MLQEDSGLVILGLVLVPLGAVVDHTAGIEAVPPLEPVAGLLTDWTGLHVAPFLLELLHVCLGRMLCPSSSRTCGSSGMLSTLASTTSLLSCPTLTTVVVGVAPDVVLLKIRRERAVGVL